MTPMNKFDAILNYHDAYKAMRVRVKDNQKVNDIVLATSSVSNLMEYCDRILRTITIFYFSHVLEDKHIK